MRTLQVLALAVALAALGGCGDPPASRATGVYLLLDTSGTYTEEIAKAQQIISFTLTRLEPGDSFAVARIDTASFSEKDIVAKATFDDRPSTANNQKRRFQTEVGEFVSGVAPSAFTDISGGLLQALEYLNEKDPGRRTIFIFSDLKEDLDAGYVRDFPLTFTDVDVVALNVTKLRSDNVDPREYLDRLAAWQQRVEQGGGRWRVINDLDRLEKLFQT
ncbi:MAG: VWA domain-containing protein [Pseudomonadales bacterium]